MIQKVIWYGDSREGCKVWCFIVQTSAYESRIADLEAKVAKIELKIVGKGSRQNRSVTSK